jgi:adenylyltransferase/sulfurtransferase
MGLSKEQVGRYGRQLILPEVGVAGQERLLASSVLIVGAGGLGSPAALYLAAAGVGTLGIVDPEPVALSNLHRQIVHASEGIGTPKTESAAARLGALNPGVAVRPITQRFAAENARALVEAYDLVLDGSDNFPTRYLVNDACVIAGRPLVHGAAVRLNGQLMVVRPRQSACYRCLFPEPPRAEEIPSCQEAGVLGPVTGIIGSLMAHEALKLLLNIGQPLTDRLLTYDGVSGRFREAALRRDPSCAVCGEAPAILAPVAIDSHVCLER